MARHLELPALFAVFRDQGLSLLRQRTEATAQIWTQFLHATRFDDVYGNIATPSFSRWSSISRDFFELYQEHVLSEPLSLETPRVVIALFVALSSLAPSTLRPIDSFFKLLQKLFASEVGATLCFTQIFKEEHSKVLSRATPLLLSFLCNINEEKALIRIETLIENPTAYLAK